MKIEIYTEERTEFNDFVIKRTEYDEDSLRIDGKFLIEHDKQIRAEVINEFRNKLFSKLIKLTLSKSDFKLFDNILLETYRELKEQK